MKWCPQCRRVRFKIGLPVFEEVPDLVRVCSRPCKERYLKELERQRPLSSEEAAEEMLSIR